MFMLVLGGFHSGIPQLLLVPAPLPQSGVSDIVWGFVAAEFRQMIKRPWIGVVSRVVDADRIIARRAQVGTFSYAMLSARA